MTLADRMGDWIRGHVERAGASGVVIGLSGGIDSAVVAGVSARALGGDHVLGAILPAYSQQLDIEHGRLVAQTFNTGLIEIDLAHPFDVIQQLLPQGNQMANANLKPRLRMLTLYHLANTNNMLVVGTGNRSELMAGYFTKYGDGGVDLLPLGSLYKQDVRQLARQINVPEPIVEKAPSAGLWAGQTDEQEMGISYDALDGILAALDRGETPSGFSAELVAKVEQMISRSAHKRRMPPVFEVSQPISALHRA